MLKQSFLAVLFISSIFYSFSMPPIDKTEKVYKVSSFGKGVLESSYAGTGLMSSVTYFTYKDGKGTVLWKSALDLSDLPSQAKMYGICESQLFRQEGDIFNESNIMRIGDDVFLSNETSQYAFGMKQYLSKENKDYCRFFKVNLEGKITHKDISNLELFPFLTKKSGVSLYSSFVANDKFYVIYQHTENKLENKYYLVEIDEDFNFKSKELDDTKVLVKDVEDNKVSKIRIIEQNDQNLIYYKVEQKVKGFELVIHCFDLKSFNSNRKYIIEMPFENITKLNSPYRRKSSSIEYDQGVFQKNDWSTYHQVESGTATSYLYSFNQLSNIFSTYFENNTVYFFGEYEDINSKTTGSFIANIELNDELEKKTYPELYLYSKFSNSSVLLQGEKKDQPYVGSLAFNPKTKNLIISGTSCYNIEKNKLVLVSDKNIIEPFFALHPEYLTKKKNGKSIFPSEEGEMISKYKIFDSEDRVIITYFRRTSETHPYLGVSVFIVIEKNE